MLKKFLHSVGLDNLIIEKDATVSFVAVSKSNSNYYTYKRDVPLRSYPIKFFEDFYMAEYSSDNTQLVDSILASREAVEKQKRDNKLFKTRTSTLMLRELHFVVDNSLWFSGDYLFKIDGAIYTIEKDLTLRDPESGAWVLIFKHSENGETLSVSFSDEEIGASKVEVFRGSLDEYKNREDIASDGETKLISYERELKEKVASFSELLGYEKEVVSLSKKYKKRYGDI